MKITERDIAILGFINQFGFCETIHLSKQFKIEPNYMCRIARRLVRAGFLIKEKQFYGKYALYHVTPHGAAFTSLPPLRKLSAGAYHHSVVLINLYFKLIEQYPFARWVSERILLNEKFSRGVGKMGHTPDALLFLEDKQIAIEVELTVKNKWRLETIMKNYTLDIAMHEVWYFCSNDVLVAVKKLANVLLYIKVFEIESFLEAKQYAA